jgi:hypothetical protein
LGAGVEISGKIGGEARTYKGYSRLCRGALQRAAATQAMRGKVNTRRANGRAAQTAATAGSLQDACDLCDRDGSLSQDLPIVVTKSDDC